MRRLRVGRRAVGRLTVGLLALGLLGVALAPAALAPAALATEIVVVEGRVVDPAGEPLAGSTVVLEMRRKHFSLRRFERTIGEPLQMVTTSGDDGRFRFTLQPESHYNLFELGVGVEVLKNGRPTVEILARRTLTDEIAAGGTVSVTLEVAQAGFLRWLERWRDDRASEDEERIFRDLGRPDRLTADDDGSTAWWYFAEGKVYRLRGGALEQVQHFDPVPEAPPSP
ncbi:MAG: carboxypeptidase-like regulatory domain-containing protein [Acidobacteriota bacterium]